MFRCMPGTYVLPELWIAKRFYAVNDCSPLTSAPAPRSLMKVGVPLGNSTCYVFNEYIFWPNTKSQRLTFTNQRQPLTIHIGTSEVGLASVPLGIAPQYAPETWFSPTFWISKSQGHCRCWYCTCAISDFVSYCVPLGWGEICPIDVRSLKPVGVPVRWCEICPLMWESAGARIIPMCWSSLHLNRKDSRHLTSKSWKQLGAYSRSINLRSTNWTCPHWHVSLVVVSLPVPHLTAPTYYSYSEGNRRSEPWHESWSSNGSTGINCNVNKLRYDNADAGHENQRSFRVKQAMSCCFNLPWGELM